MRGVHHGENDIVVRQGLRIPFGETICPLRQVGNVDKRESRNTSPFAQHGARFTKRPIGRRGAASVQAIIEFILNGLVSREAVPRQYERLAASVDDISASLRTDSSQAADLVLLRGRLAGSRCSETAVGAETHQRVLRRYRRAQNGVDRSALPFHSSESMLT